MKVTNTIEKFSFPNLSTLGSPQSMVSLGRSLGLIPSGSTVTTPPDNSLLIGRIMRSLDLPYVQNPGHIRGTYTLDANFNLSTGTLNSLKSGIVSSGTPSGFIAVMNDPTYNITSKSDDNSADEILITTADGKYMFPFYDGKTNVSDPNSPFGISEQISAYDISKMFTTIISLIETMKIKRIPIPLYTDLKVLFWASIHPGNKLSNGSFKYRSYITNKYPNIPDELIPLGCMVILGENPLLDKSKILYTGDLRATEPQYDEDNVFIPPTTDQNNNTIPDPISATTSTNNYQEKLTRYRNICQFLDTYYKVYTKEISTYGLKFAANFENIPPILQKFDYRNPSFIIPPSIPETPMTTTLTTVPNPTYTGGPRNTFSPLPNDTYLQPPNPATYSPPDINLQNGPLPFITKTGYINNYTLDSNGVCNGMLNGRISTTVSYIPIENKSAYKINPLNDPDQILITTDDGKYIFPFGDGTMATYNPKYFLSFISYAVASFNNTMTIPLYNDLRILYYAANSQLNNFTSLISNNRTYSSLPKPLLPLVKMLILSNDPSIDKSTILITGDLSVQNYETDPRTGLYIPPTTDQNGSPIPSSLLDSRASVYSNLFYFLDSYRLVSTGQVNLSDICLSFTSSTINILPSSLQIYDCRNVKFAKKKSLPNTPLPQKQENPPETDYSSYYPLIGIGVGIFCCVLIIGGAVFFFMMKSKKNKTKSRGGYYYDIDTE